MVKNRLGHSVTTLIILVKARHDMWKFDLITARHSTCPKSWHVNHSTAYQTDQIIPLLTPGSLSRSSQLCCDGAILADAAAQIQSVGFIFLGWRLGGSALTHKLLIKTFFNLSSLPWKHFRWLNLSVLIPYYHCSNESIFRPNCPIEFKMVLGCLRFVHNCFFPFWSNKLFFLLE